MYVAIRCWGKSSVNQNAAREFFCELREEAAEWELYKISACALSFDRNSSSAAFLRALSRPYQPLQIEDRIRNDATIIIHPPRLQTFPAIKPSTEV